MFSTYLDDSWYPWPEIEASVSSTIKKKQHQLGYDACVCLSTVRTTGFNSGETLILEIQIAILDWLKCFNLDFLKIAFKFFWDSCDVMLQKEWRDTRDEFKKKVGRCVRKSQELLWFIAGWLTPHCAFVKWRRDIPVTVDPCRQTAIGTSTACFFLFSVVFVLTWKNQLYSKLFFGQCLVIISLLKF